MGILKVRREDGTVLLPKHRKKPKFIKIEHQGYK